MSSEARIAKLVEKMKASQANVSFADLVKVCDFYFGDSRQHGTSHRVYRPQAGQRINIQKQGSKAKTYQVRQVLTAIEQIKENE